MKFINKHKSDGTKLWGETIRVIQGRRNKNFKNDGAYAELVCKCGCDIFNVGFLGDGCNMYECAKCGNKAMISDVRR